MAGEWLAVTVAAVAAPIKNALVGGPFGSNLISRDYVTDGVPVIRGQNMDARWVGGEFVFVSPTKAAELYMNTARPGDLVFTQRGTLGQVAVVPQQPYQRYIVSQSQMKLTVDRHKADVLFLYYYFGSKEQQEYIRRNAIQTGVPHTNLEHLRTTPLRLPPLSEQRAIAHILGTLDDKIELNRRMNETLEAMARTLFKSWFVDFDPVRAKAEGRQPVGMDAETASLFPDGFEESELGTIPQGWGWASIADFASLDKGVSYKGEGLTETGVPMINLGCFLGHGRFSDANLKHYEGDFKPRHEVHPGDIVLANTDITQKREILGSPAIVPAVHGHEAYIFTHHVYALRFMEGRECWQDFTYFLLLQPAFRERAEGFATGTTVLALPKDAVLGHEFVMPPDALTRRFSNALAPMLALLNANANQSKTLASTRDALLPKLLSGEVRVKEAEKVVEEVIA